MLSPQGGGAMGGSTVDGRDGEFIRSTMEMLVRFSAEVTPRLADWEARLRDLRSRTGLIGRANAGCSCNGRAAIPRRDDGGW